ncbi:MAG: LPXTG cell wall anchor domain-containing protein [Acidimicrobiales bacterium]
MENRRGVSVAKRWAFGFALAGSALVASAAPAFATDGGYGTVVTTTISPSTTAAPPGVDLDDNTVSPGQVVVITSRGHRPGSTVQFFILSTPQSLGTAVANSQGVATFPATIPAGFSGAHTILVVGEDTSGNRLEQSVPIIVTSGGLPATGSDVAGLVAIGAVVLAGGAALVVVSRRRRPVAA